MAAGDPGGRAPAAPIGVIGGSGFYRLLDDAEHLVVDTPYGAPSEPVALGELSGHPVAFLPRHGRDHRFPPHRVPYRANLWALRSLGVRQVLAPCAAGSLRPDLGPGALVVPDQLVDRTSGRAQTFHDTGTVHVSFAEPYCPTGRATLLRVAAERGAAATDGGTMVVVEGPRFSTKAESQSYAAAGWSLVNMTAFPEAVLARELALCYTTVALVTDYDAGVEAGVAAVSQAEVFRVFAENIERLRALLHEVVPTLPARRDCLCAAALDGMRLGFALP